MLLCISMHAIACIVGHSKVGHTERPLPQNSLCRNIGIAVVFDKVVQI